MKNSHQVSMKWLRGGMLVLLAISFLPRGLQAQFAPPTVTVKSGPEQLTVEWNEVEGATGYKVQWRNSSTEADAENTDWDASRQAMEPGTSRSSLIEDLDPAITYEVRAFAKDMYGDYSNPSNDPDGDGTPISPLTTGTPAPGQVTGVTVTVPAAAGQLTVTWDGLDVATNYKVQWRDPDEVDSWEDFEPDDDGTDPDNEESVAASTSDPLPTTYSHTITATTGGLSAENTYIVRVIATNGVDTEASNGGDGTPSDDATGRPRPGQVNGPGDATDDPLTVEPGEGKLTVKWEGVEGADEYKVQWKSGTQDWDPSNRQGMEDQDATSHEITGLTAGTEYTVRVFATNGDDTDASDGGDGTPSVEATGTPQPGQVTGVTVTSDAAAELTVSWTAVSGTGIEYKVQWRDATSVTSWDDFTPTDGTNQATATATSYTISPSTPLTVGTEYTVRVIATHDAAAAAVEDVFLADGTPSEDATGTPRPGQVQNLAQNPAPASALPGEVTVTWDRLIGADSYTVQWKLATEVNYDGTRLATIDQTPTGENPSHRITGLGSAAHTVQVYATNNDEQDGAQDGAPLELSVTPGTPGNNQVTGVTVTPGSQQLTVEWVAVTGATEYKVQWWKGDDATFDAADDDEKGDVTGIRGTRYTIRSLDEDTEYMVQVINGEDDGTASPVTDQWTKPGQVTGVTAEATSGQTGQLTVGWTVATTVGTRTDGGYKVQWRTGSENWDPDSRQVDVTGASATGTTIGDETPASDMPLGGTLYRVRVIAYNDGGDGDPSGEARATPLAAQVATPTVTPGPEELKVVWVKANGAYRYKVQWTTESGFTGFTATEGTNQKTVTDDNPEFTPEFTIEGLTGGTPYQVRVIAENESGTAAEGTVNATSGTPAPGMVGTLTVTAGSEQLTVEWDAVTGATSYKVQWRVPDENASWGADDFTAAENDNQATVTGSPLPTSYTISPTSTPAATSALSADTEYTVRVVPVVGTVDGTPSADATGRPAPGQIEDDTGTSDVDEGVTVTPLEGALKVSWGEVSGATGYTVQWKSGSDPYSRNNQADLSETEREITPLTAGVQYTVRVFAYNGDASDASDGGVGPSSDEATGTPQPGQVTGVTVTSDAAAELTVSWTAVSGTGIEYKVQWRDATSVTSWDDFTPTDGTNQATATATSYTISPSTPLTVGTEYTVRVIATHDAAAAAVEDVFLADGTPSDDETGIPRPGPVQTLAVATSPANGWAATVTWDRLTGADNGYIVQWKLATEVNYDRTRQATEPQTEETQTTVTHRITGLTAGTAYTVQVYATNDGGHGPATSPAANHPFTPVASTGNQVVGVMVTAGSEELTVTWDRVPGATGYKVQWNSDGTYDDLTVDTDDPDDRTADASGTSYTITGLTGGTTYNVQVIAVVGGENQSPSATGSTGIPKPGKVTIKAVRLGEGTLNVSWDEVTGVTGYTVQWREDSQQYSSRSRMKQPTPATATQIELDMDDLRGPGQLMPSGQKYWVQVYATNASGDGPTSDEVAGTPLPGKVDDTDENRGPVTVTRGPQQLEVGWDAVPGATGYTVQWKSGSQDFDNLLDSDDAADTRTARLGVVSSYTIENLIAGTQYTVQVFASNAGGLGAASDLQRGTPAPGTVTGVTVTAGSGALTVSWTAVPGAAGYKIQWKSGSEEYDPATREGRRTGLSYTIESLSADTEYTVQVIATLDLSNSNTPETDDSAPSDEATGTPLPGKVASVNVVAGAEKLLLSWDEVTGADGYTVQWRSGQQTFADAATDNREATDITGTRYTIEGLTADPATQYTVQVIAYNASGNGDPSDEATGTPVPVAEGQVANVMVDPGPERLAVSWSMVPGATGYKVQWKSGSETFANAATDDREEEVTGLSYTIPDLEPDTEYTVRVIAVLSTGDGPDSDEAFGTPTDRLGQVANVMVTPGPYHLSVAWDEVTGATGYKVQWKSGDEDYDETNRQALIEVGDDPGFSHTSIGLGGRTAGIEYTIQVIATIIETGDADDGPASAPATGTPQPGQVTNVRAAGVEALTVSWKAVPDATMYRVYWKSGTQDFDASRLAEVTSGTRHVIPNLTVGTQYTVFVVAGVASVYGQPSDEVTGTPTRRRPSTPSTPSTPTPQPPTTPPAQPTTPPVTSAPKDPKPGKVVLSSVKAGAEGGQLAVKWRVMAKASGYKVQWKSGDQDFSSSRQARVSGMLAVNHVIGDLDYTIEHMVRVIAYNQHGDGPPSDSREATPKRGVPKNNLAIEDPDEARTVGQAISLTVSVAEEGAHVLEVTGGRGVTLSGDGVTDQGGGSAQLDADSWSEGQRTVVLNDTVGPDVLSIVLRNTDGDSLAGLSGIMYNPGEASQLVVTGLPDTLAVGRAYRGQVSATDSYGNVRTEDREVTISTDARNVSSSSPVELEEGTGGFWVRSDEVPATALVLTFEDSEDSDLSSSVSVTVRPLDAPDRVVAADNPGDEGGFVLLTWDLSDDHSILDTYRIFRGEGSAREWGSVAAAPGATEGRAVVATLDTMSSVWGVLGQIGGSSMMDDMACMADIVVTGSDVDGLEVLVWRTGSGNRVSSPRSSNILWKGTTDATGQVSLSVNNSGRTSSYAATARRDGELVASWRGIQLTPSDCPSLELAIGGEATVGGATDQRPSVVLMSSITQSGSARALDNTPPAAAGSFRAVDVPDDDGGQIQLSWTESASDVSITRSVEGAVGPVTSDMSRGVVGYRIYREEAEGFALLGTVGPGVTGFVDTTAITGIRFTYVVSAFDQDNETVSEEEEAMSIRNREEDVNGKLIQGLFGADKTVGFDDYFHFADHYGSSVEDTEWEPAFDLAAKQAVDIDGYNVFAENFGRQTASAAKVIPLEPGRNEQTRLDFFGGVPLPRVGEEFVLTLHLSDFGLLKGYGFQVEFDGEELEVVRAVAADNGLGEGILANPQVLAVAEGKQAIVAYGDEVSEGTVAVELVFRALREFEDGWIRITEGQVRDGAFAVNPLVLPAPVQMETLPEVYALGFNYPNPFNPETTIKYALPQASDVKLVVYNSIGQVVRTLVNERQSIGRYAFTWDATNDRGQAVSSGIYLYRLQAGEFAQVRKMLLLK